MANPGDPFREDRSGRRLHRVGGRRVLGRRGRARPFRTGDPLLDGLRARGERLANEDRHEDEEARE